MEYTDEQIDHIINLAKQLELRKQLEREEQASQEAIKRLHKTWEIIRERRSLKEQKHNLEELRYNLKTPDPPIDLGDGKVLVTIWKVLPEHH
jgi:hypothetical protein